MTRAGVAARVALDTAAATPEAMLWEVSLDMIALAGLDGHLTRVNAAWQNTLGYTPDELTARPYLDFVHPDDVSGTRAKVAALLEPGHTSIRFENRYRAKDGTYRWLSWSCTASDGSAVYLVVRDVTPSREADAERVALHERLSERESLLNGVVESAPIGMAVTALYGKVLRTNRALREITGYGDAALLELSSLQEITHPDDQQVKGRQVWTLNAIDGSTHHCQQRLLHAGGHIVWVETSTSLVRDANGDPVHMVVQFQDISERRKLEERLQNFAEVDALTGMRNRRLFEDDLRTQVARCRRYGEQAALLLFDLDEFKKVNDTYGHKVGDDVLKAVATAVKQRLRTGDLAARLGGDEFAILLSSITPAQADAVAADVRRLVLDATVSVGDEVLSPRISIGIALIDGHATDDEAVLAEADRSMYAAKHAGKRATRG
jgi:diguanylate cyclase (GGDEF)-like protein/PAS domain S-box-containing protein